MAKIKEFWEYEICDIMNDIGMIDANKLLEAGWEPFSATEGIIEGRPHINLWLRKFGPPEEE